MKEVYVKFPLVELSNQSEVFKASNYPSTGRYLVRYPNNDKVIVDVYSFNEEEDKASISQYIIGNQEMVLSDIVEKNIQDKVTELTKAKIDEVKHEYEMKVEKLEHEYALRQAEIPKRNGQSEWVSGKTLTEIIKTLACDKIQHKTVVIEEGVYYVADGCAAVSEQDGRKVVVSRKIR